MRDCDDAVVEHAHPRADGVAVRLRPDEREPDAAVAGELIVPEEHGWAVVGRHEQVDVAVAIEVAAGEAAADPRPGEVGAGRRGDVLKLAVAQVSEEERRLSVRDARAEAPHGLVDVPVGERRDRARHPRSRSAKRQPNPSRLRDAAPTPAAHRHVLVEARTERAIEPGHLVVEVGDRDAHPARVLEVGRIDAHAGAGAAIGAERDTRLDADLLEGAVALRLR